jgi:hypothetical protein
VHIPDPEQLKKTEREFKDIMLASVKSYHQTCIEKERSGQKPEHTSIQVFNVLRTLQLFQKVELGDAFKNPLESNKNGNTN